MNSIKNLFKSKIVWTNVVAILLTLFDGWGKLGLIDARIANALVFALTIVWDRWASFSTIFTTGVNINWALVWLNVGGIVVMLGDYFMANRLFDFFGNHAQQIGMMVFTISTVIRMGFTNQPAKE